MVACCLSSETLIALLVIAGYGLVLWAAMRWRGRQAQSPWMSLLRGFFPSWHFFDRIGHRPLLQIRALQGDADWSRWQSFQPRSKRSWHGLFFQPQASAQLFQQSLIDQLALELGDQQLSNEALLDRSAYQSVQGFADSLVRLRDEKAHGMQFRLLLIDPLIARSIDPLIAPSIAPSIDPWIEPPCDVSSCDLCDEPIAAEDERLVLLSAPISWSEHSAPTRTQAQGKAEGYGLTG